MSSIIKKVKNSTGAEVVYLGQAIEAGQYYQLQYSEQIDWANSTVVQGAVTAGTLVINNGTADLSAADGLVYLKAVDATALGGVVLDSSGIGDQKKLVFDSASGKLKYLSESTGSAAGNKGQIQYRGTAPGSFTASEDLEWDAGKMAFIIGGVPPGQIGGLATSFKKTVNSWAQTIMQNLSTGGYASADIIAQNDLGDDSGYYVDLGITSSGYSQTDSLPNEGYVYCNGGHFSAGTETAGKDFYVFAGGFDKEKLRFYANAADKDAKAVFKCVVVLDAGTTENRPTSPTNGMVRYNTTISKFEGYENGAWTNLIVVPGEANTTSNVGAGEGTLAKDKSGVNLPFKSIKQGSGITVTNNTDDITIAAVGGAVTQDSQKATAGDTVSTTSTSWVDVPNMTLTTNNSGSKGYEIHFICTWAQSKNGHFSNFRIVADGVETSVRRLTNPSGGSVAQAPFVCAMHWLVNLGNAKVVKVQYYTDPSTGTPTIEVSNRSLIIRGL